MNFLNPLFLFGLLAVAIPVVLHLIHFHRPRKISFSTLSFFNKLRQSTLRRIRIKQLILLALRTLAIAFLAFAVARPILTPALSGSTSSGSAQAIAIIIDNSSSMSRIGSQGPLVDQAKEVARSIVQNGHSGDQFLILSTNSNSKSTSFVKRRQVEQRIGDISATNTAHFTQESIQTAYNQLQQSSLPQGRVYIISDGQRSQLEEVEGLTVEDQESTKHISLQLIKLEQPRQQNIAVTSMTMNTQMITQEAPLTLAVGVENTGNTAAANQYVSLELDETVLGEYDISLQPGESHEVTFEVTPEKTGYVTGKVVIEGDEVTFDNIFYFSLKIPGERSVLLLNEEEASTPFSSLMESALEAANQTNSQLNYEKAKVEQTDLSQWQQYDAIVLDGLAEVPEYWFQDLQQFVQDGQGILFLPSEKGDVDNYNRFFSQFNGGRFDNIVGEYASFNSVAELGKVEKGHPILNELFILEEKKAINVDRPSLFFYYHYTSSSNTEAMSVLEAENGDPLLAEQHFGKGVFIVSTIGADPGWSNFPVNPLFAPLYYRSILYASSSEGGGLQQHQLGEPFVWEYPSQASEVTLAINDVQSKAEVQQHIDGFQVVDEGRSWTPGLLTVDTGENTHRIGVNQHIMESRFAALEEGEWHNLFDEAMNVNELIDAEGLTDEHLAQRLNSAVFGTEIWNWFIWFALACLITEMVVIRFYKTESIS